MDTLVLLLPAGFELPPGPYLGALVLGITAIAFLLVKLAPPVTDRDLFGLGLWVVAGGIGHAMYQRDLFPETVAPLFGTAAVYLTVAILAGTSWVIGTQLQHSSESLLTTGAVAVGVGVGYTLLRGTVGSGYWSMLAVFVAVVLTVLTWSTLNRTRPDVVAAASGAGFLVVFGHVLDGVSTAIGYDFLGAVERTPLSAMILEAGEWLPTAEAIGAGWLFVLVKLILAVGIVVLFRDYLQEAPRQARLVLFVIAAVGLGPGSHNVMLYWLG